MRWEEGRQTAERVEGVEGGRRGAAVALGPSDAMGGATHNGTATGKKEEKKEIFNSNSIRITAISISISNSNSTHCPFATVRSAEEANPTLLGGEVAAAQVSLTPSHALRQR